MSKSLLYKLGILLLLIAIVAVFEYFDEDTITIDTRNANRPTIDYFADNVNVIQYKEDGSINYKMDTDKMIHLQEKDTSYLTNPTALVYKSSPNPWHIKSDKGEVGPKGNVIYLFNNIKATQTDENGKTTNFEIGQQKEASDPIKYGQVTIHPDTKFAESDDYAIVTAPEGETSGNGIKANLETNKLQVLSNVKTRIIRGNNAN